MEDIELLTIIEERNEIKRAQARIRQKMNNVAEKSGFISIGGKGWHQEREAFWNGNLGIWWTMKEEEDRYWNSFGTGEPRWNTGYSHSIVCEVNFSKDRNPRIPGMVARDENRRTYVLHRGRIGGGRKGIGKSLFFQNFTGEWETVWGRSFLVKLALIGALDSKRFPWQVASFVHEVERIKKIPLKKSLQRPKFTIMPHFKEEFIGVKRFSQTKEIEAKCDHGLIVKKLAEILESKGFTVGNSSRMDLYVQNKKGEVERLFEIKTDPTIRSCYEAIGQLFFYSSTLPSKPLVFAVFPHTLAKERQRIFKKLGIEMLTYRWVNNQPHFSARMSPTWKTSNSSENQNRVAGLSVAPPVGLEPKNHWRYLPRTLYFFVSQMVSYV